MLCARVGVPCQGQQWVTHSELCPPGFFLSHFLKVGGPVPGPSLLLFPSVLALLLFSFTEIPTAASSRIQACIPDCCASSPLIHTTSHNLGPPKADPCFFLSLNEAVPSLAFSGPQFWSQIQSKQSNGPPLPHPTALWVHFSRRRITAGKQRVLIISQPNDGCKRPGPEQTASSFLGSALPWPPVVSLVKPALVTSRLERER